VLIFSVAARKIAKSMSTSTFYPDPCVCQPISPFKVSPGVTLNAPVGSGLKYFQFNADPDVHLITCYVKTGYDTPYTDVARAPNAETLNVFILFI